MNPIRNHRPIDYTKMNEGENKKLNKKTNNIITHYLDTTEKKVITAIGITAILTIVATKKKSIVKGIKKGFNALRERVQNLGKKETPEIKPKINPEIPPVQKFKLPEPKFTCGEENPKQLAKEKAKYIKSIWDETVTIKNKERNIAGLEAIGKYGTIDDIARLDVSYRRGHNDDERIAFAKAVASIGKGRDASWAMGILKYAEKDETKIEILKSIIKTLKKEKTTYPKYGFHEIVESFHENSNKQISDLAKQVSSLISMK